MQTLSKIGTQKKCVIFEKSNAVIQVNKKSIPEYLINDHGFINTLIERMSTFSKSDDPNKFLTRFKTTTWELVPYWRERNTEAALFREL